MLYKKIKYKWFYLKLIISIPFLIALYLLSQKNYLLYHSLIEIFSAVIAIAIFIIGWNTRKYSHNNLMIILSAGYLVVGAFDILHTLTYEGVGIFTQYDANLPTQLWTAARYILASSMFLGIYFFNKKKNLNSGIFLFLLLFIGAVLITGIFLGLFPDCYIEGSGLTFFKIISEYIISFILFIIFILIWKKRKQIGLKISKLLLFAIGFTILSEMSFTLYGDIYGFFNFLGHAFKVISDFLVYFALIEESLDNPFQLLFKEIADINKNLVRDNKRRKRAETALKKALQEKQDLFRELQHRAKNNFIMISSMINLTSNASQSEEVKLILNDLGSRVRAISEMYNLLYKIDSIKEVRLDEYCIKVISSFPIFSKKITLKYECEQIVVPVNDAIYIGIIIAELITNSSKYAFPGNRQGEIFFSLKRINDEVIIKIADNGIGMPDNFNIETTDSMGLKLVNTLVKQINGNFKINNKKGTSCILKVSGKK